MHHTYVGQGLGAEFCNKPLKFLYPKDAVEVHLFFWSC